MFNYEEQEKDIQELLKQTHNLERVEYPNSKVKCMKCPYICATCDVITTIPPITKYRCSLDKCKYEH